MIKYVVSNRSYYDVYGDEVISKGQKLSVISECNENYELDDGDGGKYRLPKSSMDVEVCNGIN